MKNLKFIRVVLTLVLFTTLIGCNESSQASKKEAKIYTVNLNRGDEVFTVIVDNCEYIIYDGYQSGNIIHKQNCKFCSVRNNNN